MGSLFCALLLASVISFAYGQNCPGFEPAPMDLVLVVGGNEMACLECAYPTSTVIQWELERDSSFSVLADTSGAQDEDCDCSVDNSGLISQLCFNNIDSSAIRNYRCVAILPDFTFSRCNFEVQAATPPVITSTSPQSRTVDISENAVFSFEYQPGSPNGTVVWSKDGTTIQTDSRITIDPVTKSLSITNAMPEDRGLYEVTITNTAGSATANFSLFVRFIDFITNSATPDQAGMILIQCIVIGYPNLRMDVTYEPQGTNVVGDVVNRDDDFFTEARFTETVPEDCSAEILCLATAGTLSSRQTLTPCSTTAPLIQTVVPSRNSAAITWTDSASSYSVEYWPKGLAEDFTRVTVFSSTEHTITELTPGQTYLVRVCRGTESTNQDCSGSREFTTSTCASTHDEPVIGVQAFTVSSGTERTITVTWMRSTEAAVAGYRINVSPCPANALCTAFATAEETSYSFSPGICDGAYQFRVQAINSCGGVGPASYMVVEECDVQNRLTSLVPSPTGFTLHWDFVDTVTMLNITAKNVVPDTNNQISTSIFQVASTAISNNRACIGGLVADSPYIVCLVAVFSDGNPPNMYCNSASTLSEGSSPDNCLEIADTSTTDSGVNPTPTSVIENWHIAIIVVGALAIVAMVFCLVGLCFACQSSKQKVDFGSNESLSTTYNTNSVKDAVSMQRSMSPSRSCLSYHHKGHSTNWNDHVDTLRQMETVDGTNV